MTMRTKKAQPNPLLMSGAVLVLAVCGLGCAPPALYLDADVAYYEATAPVLSHYLEADESLEAFDRRNLLRLIRARGYSLAARARSEGVDWEPPK